MWFYIAVLGSVVLALAVIIAVIVRKSRQLTLIDTAALPQERENRIKREIMRERVGRIVSAKGAAAAERLKPVLAAVDRVCHGALEGLRRVEHGMERSVGKAPPPKISPAERKAEVAALLEQAERLAIDGSWAEAEKKFVAVIGLDMGSVPAYRGLGDLYLEIRNYSQAKETYTFLVRMMEKRCAGAGKGPASPSAIQAETAKDYVRLSAACKALGDMDGAKAALESAVSFESANPRLLDLLIETCIMAGDKGRALEIYERLKSVNPDNQKLRAMYERIAGIGAPEEAAAKVDADLRS